MEKFHIFENFYTRNLHLNSISMEKYRRKTKSRSLIFSIFLKNIPKLWKIFQNHGKLTDWHLSKIPKLWKIFDGRALKV